MIADHYGMKKEGIYDSLQPHVQYSKKIDESFTAYSDSEENNTVSEDEEYENDTYTASQKWLTDALKTSVLLILLNGAGGPLGLSYILPITKRLLAGYTAPYILPFASALFYCIEHSASGARKYTYGETKFMQPSELRTLNSYDALIFWNYTVLKVALTTGLYLQLLYQHSKKDTPYTKTALLTNWATIVYMLYPLIHISSFLPYSITDET
jgi:hypothetical protein